MEGISVNSQGPGLAWDRVRPLAHVVRAAPSTQYRPVAPLAENRSLLAGTGGGGVSLGRSYHTLTPPSACLPPPPGVTSRRGVDQLGGVLNSIPPTAAPPFTAPHPPKEPDWHGGHQVGGRGTGWDRS